MKVSQRVKNLSPSESLPIIRSYFEQLQKSGFSNERFVDEQIKLKSDTKGFLELFSDEKRLEAAMNASDKKIPLAMRKTDQILDFIAQHKFRDGEIKNRNRKGDKLDEARLNKYLEEGLLPKLELLPIQTQASKLSQSLKDPRILDDEVVFTQIKNLVSLVRLCEGNDTFEATKILQKSWDEFQAKTNSDVQETAIQQLKINKLDSILEASVGELKAITRLDKVIKQGRGVIEAVQEGVKQGADRLMKTSGDFFTQPMDTSPTQRKFGHTVARKHQSEAKAAISEVRNAHQTTEKQTVHRYGRTLRRDEKDSENQVPNTNSPQTPERRGPGSRW